MKVALWAEARRLREIEGLSQREIARRLRCSRDTVHVSTHTNSRAYRTDPACWDEVHPPRATTSPNCPDTRGDTQWCPTRKSTRRTGCRVTSQ
jgi:hypothetical protein